MRAAVMREGKLLVDTLPEPEPGPGEVLVKTLACGICGSDLHVLKHAERLVEAARESGTSAFVMDLQRGVVMGHEFCAEIVDHGPGSQKTLRAGTRVCSMPVLLRPDRVAGVGYSSDFPGGYGEYMVLSEPLLLEVPEGLATEHAALTEPMAVGLHAVEKASLTSDDAPLVIGCGPVGLSVIAALKLKGVAPIVAADFSAGRRALAERLGADIIVDPAATSPYTTWREAAEAQAGDVPPAAAALLGPQRPGVVFECVGVPGVINEILRGAVRGTRVVVAGVCMEDDPIQPLYAINKELNVQFVLGYSPEEFATTLRHIAEGAIPLEPLITGRVGVEGVAQAFEDLASPERHAKILVEHWRS
jgi:threonine dehydrogenase-like Zn-dependent dehydrogenase